jgi:hypothetical protein
MVKRMSQNTTTPPAHTAKEYACNKCGTVVMQTTNHTGSTWSWGRVNCCPNCPPHAKYSEFGGSTLWLCVQTMTAEQKLKLFGVGHNK